jgi:hypothetical protein
MTTPIRVHVLPMLARIPNFQSAARIPPIKMMKPTKYMLAHFIVDLL